MSTNNFFVRIASEAEQQALKVSHKIQDIFQVQTRLTQELIKSFRQATEKLGYDYKLGLEVSREINLEKLYVLQLVFKYRHKEKGGWTTTLYLRGFCSHDPKGTEKIIDSYSSSKKIAAFFLDFELFDLNLVEKMANELYDEIKENFQSYIFKTSYKKTLTKS